MSRRRKPEKLEVGKAYRLSFFGMSADRHVALVTGIEQVTKTTRRVRIEWLEGGPGWHCTPYSDFLRSVWREERTAIH